MPIEQYSFGKILVDGKEYQGDLVISDTAVKKWPCHDHHHPTFDDFPEIARESYDVLIIGKGNSGMMEINKNLQRKLETLVPNVILATTPQSCQAHNQLTRENKKIITYLHLTC